MMVREHKEGERIMIIWSQLLYQIDLTPTNEYAFDFKLYIENLVFDRSQKYWFILIRIRFFTNFECLWENVMDNYPFSNFEAAIIGGRIPGPLFDIDRGCWYLHQIVSLN